MKQRRRLACLWLVVVGLLLAHTGWLWADKRIVPDTDILSLLPAGERDPALQRAFSNMVDAGQQRVIVLVGAADWDQARRAADAYRAVLAPHGELLQLADQAGDQVQRDWLALFHAHRMALMTASDEAALRNQTVAYWIDAALRALYSPFPGPRLGSWKDDPFDLFAHWALARAQETPVRPRDGRLYVANEEREYVALPMTVRPPAFSLSTQQAVMPLLTKARAAAIKAVPEADVIAAGVILHAAAASEQAAGEISTIGAGSLAGIVLLTLLAFRSFKPIALVLLSVGIGCLGALSVCLLVFDRVHLLTLVFGASLIGVAEDYGIYFLCNRMGADATVDSSQLLRRLLPGLLLTLAAAVIGYMGLALTPFPGLRQMAVFSAVGLIFAWLTVVFWFPLLAGPDTLHSGRIVHWYGGILAHWPTVARDRATAMAALVFFAFVAYGWSRLDTNDDIRLLQNPPRHLVEDQIRIGKLLAAPTPVQFYLVRGDTADMVLEREELLRQRLDSAVEERLISGYHAMSNWVPSAQTQAMRRQLVQYRLLGDGTALGGVADKIRQSPGWVNAIRDHALASAALLAPEDFLRAPSSEPWRHLWLGPVEGGYASVVALRGVSTVALPKLSELASGVGGVQWVDKVEQVSSVLARYRQYMGWVLAGSYLAVFALLSARYRRAAWRVLLPIALASAATLALLGISGRHLDLFHVLALMLLLGVGIDYGIFLQEQADGTAWLAVGLSAISTLLSFGLLGLSKTPALHAFGFTMLVGVTLVWLIAPCFVRREPRAEAA